MSSIINWDRVAQLAKQTEDTYQAFWFVLGGHTHENETAYANALLALGQESDNVPAVVNAIRFLETGLWGDYKPAHWA